MRNKLWAVAPALVATLWAAGVAVGAPANQTPAPGKPQASVEKQAEAQMEKVSDTIADALWVKTDEYNHAGNIEPVIGICRQIVQLDPTFVEAYTTGAWVAAQSGRDGEALAFYKAGMAANPDDWDIPHELGLIFYDRHKHDPKAALPYLKKAAEMPSPVMIKRTYAHALTKVGKYQEAAAEWRHILTLAPDDRVAKRELKKLRDAGRIGPEE